MTPANPTVLGLAVDDEFRCAHYSSKLDIVAIKFPCCGEFYACIQCHEQVADHQVRKWQRQEFEEKAILCGACKYQLSIDEYLHGSSLCPNCGHAFNPGCAAHHHLYFELDPGSPTE